MADFKTHTLAGSGIGIGLAFLTYASDWSRDVPILILIYIASIIGSYLPDIDSDSGRPVRIIFTFFGLIGFGLFFLLGFISDVFKLLELLFYSFLVFIGIRYILSFIFRKFTKHRGIYHSIPFLIICFLLTLFITAQTNLSSKIQLIFAVSVAFGFLSHLVLDEIFATKSFMGIPYKTNGSFGKALKFRSQSKSSTIIVYGFLLLLMYADKEILSKVLRLLH
jgi:hypothetical protein